MNIKCSLKLTCMDNATLRMKIIESPEEKPQIYLKKRRWQFAVLPAPLK
jgi:hypothetical protein